MVNEKLPQYHLAPVSGKEERDFMRMWHYSKKTTPNSSVKIGCFQGASLVGVATFGRIINCVQLFSHTSNREGLEINRLAMVDEAPKNSESWFLMRSIALIRKKYPWLKFIITWADGLRCNGGTIYKACGFSYIRKRPIEGFYRLPNGQDIHQIAFDKVYLKRYYNLVKNVKGRLEKVQAVFGPDVKELRGGYQYQYLYLLDKALEKQMIFKPMPYEKNDVEKT